MVCCQKKIGNTSQFYSLSRFFPGLPLGHCKSLRLSFSSISTTNPSLRCLLLPEIYLNEGQLQKMYQYPNGTNWEFLLHALGFRKIPTPKERIAQGYEAFINSTTDFNDDQLKVLAKMKDIFATNLSSKQEIDIKKIFANPIYEKIIGKKEKINHLFAGRFDTVVSELKRNLKLPNA